MTTLADHLASHARLRGQQVALVSDGSETTYAELDRLVSLRAQALRTALNRGQQGRCVVFRNTQDRDFIVTYLATRRAGLVAVPMEGDTPDDRLLATRQAYARFDPPEGVADILFTTGTTGQAKGVMLSHEAIAANAENLIEAHGYSPDHVFVANGPLNHIGSLSKLWPTLTVGGIFSVLPGLKDLSLFLAALDYPAPRAATFLVPASVKILLQLAPQQLAARAGKIDFIESGAAPMPQADMQALCRLLPSTRLFNTYASTETGIACTYNYNDGRCLGACLGPPMKNTRILITPEGRVACQGRTLMSGYALPTETTGRTTIGCSEAPATFVTADRGHLDSEGMLRLEGRADDMINVGGFKVAPTEVENVAASSPMVSDCLCVAVPSAMTGQALKLLVVAAAGVDFNKRDLARFIAQKLESYKVPTRYELVDSIRRTFNGKPDRKFYRQP